MAVSRQVQSLAQIEQIELSLDTTLADRLARGVQVVRDLECRRETAETQVLSLEQELEGASLELAKVEKEVGSFEKCPTCGMVLASSVGD